MKVSELLFLLDIMKTKVWDAEENKCTGVLMGHTGSVKCLSSHPTNSGRFLEHIFFVCLFRKSWSFNIIVQQILFFLGREMGPLPFGI